MRIPPLLLLVLAACAEKEPEAAPPRGVPVVYTTFYPTTYFAERIGGDRVEVVCPLPADADPIFWEPARSDVAAYQRADLIVVNGAGFEKWVQRVSLPDARIVDTARPFTAEFLRYEGAATHSHGRGGAHSHEGLDGHTWVDPRLAKTQARQILRALVRRLPEHEEELTRRFEALAEDLDALDQALAALGKPPRALYASHPAYNYLARRYGWTMVNLDLDPETMPADEAIAALKDTLETTPGRHLLWESAPKPEIAARLLAELGLLSLEFSPCEMAPDQGDYLSVMRANVERVKAAFAR